jgi:hypothetical protein
MLLQCVPVNDQQPFGPMEATTIHTSSRTDQLPVPRDQEEAQLLLRAAQKNVKDLNKKAATLQMSYLEDQAMLLEGKSNPKAAEIQKRILKAELRGCSTS